MKKNRTWMTATEGGITNAFGGVFATQKLLRKLSAWTLIVCVFTACGGGKYYTGDGDLSRLRSEPDAQADNVIAVIGAGEMVTVLEKGKKAPTESPWFKVRLKDGTEGWVDSGFLSAVTDTAVIAEAEAADKAAQEAAKAATQAQKAVEQMAKADPLALLSGDWFLDGGNFWKISVSGGDWMRSRSKNGDKTWEAVEKGTVAAVKGKKNMFNATVRQTYGLDSEEWTIEWTLSADGTSFTMQDDVGGDVTFVKSARKD